MKKIFQIKGMSCGGCVNHIKNTLLQIPGVENAVVQLSPQSVLLTMSEPVALDLLKAQLLKAGNYSITEMVPTANE